MKKHTTCLMMITLAVACGASASEVRYKPVNPSFGGSSFNSSHLLAIADANNHYKEPQKDYNSVDNFSRTITNSLLSRISSEIADQIYGENAQDSGNFTIGDTRIDFNRSNGQVLVNINDLGTGATTTVEIPAPTF